MLIATLVLTTGQGQVAFASMLSDLCPHPAKQMALHSCCEQEAAQIKPSNSKELKNHSCCRSIPISKEYQAVPAQLAQDDAPIIITTAHFNPVQGLQVTDAGAPVWLYKLLYPDKSNLYLERRRLLL